MEEFDRLVLRAVVGNRPSAYDAAANYSMLHELTDSQIDKSHQRVERWLRIYGALPLLESEERALVVMQKQVRKWLVRVMWEKELVLLGCFRHNAKYNQRLEKITNLKVLWCTLWDTHVK